MRLSFLLFTIILCTAAVRHILYNIIGVVAIITILTIVYHYAHQPGGSRVAAKESAARSETSARDFQSRIRNHDFSCRVAARRLIA